MNAEQASGTARLIAAATVMREEVGRGRAISGPAGAGEWCERFLSTNRSDRLLLWSTRSTVGRVWWRFAEWVAIPGLVSHWMCRKRAITRLARQAAADGFQQLVVVGGGLDSLAFRFDLERVFDRILSADHPATLSIVRAATSSPDADSPRPSRGSYVHGVELISLDLDRDDVYGTISTSRNFDARLPTVVVIEGVLMYLSAPTVELVLRSIARLSTARLRLIASSMIVDAGDSPGFRGQSRWVRRWLSRRHEPMLWGSNREELYAMLTALGWSDVRVIDLSEQLSGNSHDTGGLPSEILVIAERQGPGH